MPYAKYLKAIDIQDSNRECVRDINNHSIIHTLKNYNNNYYKNEIRGKKTEYAREELDYPDDIVKHARVKLLCQSISGVACLYEGRNTSI